MKRNPRKLRWTKAFRKAHHKEMTADSTFEFEKRRNVPVRYDRYLMEATLKAMKRVAEIKAAREARFYAIRMKDKAKKEKQEILRTIKQGIDLVQPAVVRKQKEQLNLSDKVKAAEKAERKMSD